MVDLSIIIISYNTTHLTKKCLETVVDSLNGVTFSAEIIVLDNNSTDGSVEMLKNFKFQIFSQSEITLRMTNFKLILRQQNLGFSKGNNAAVKESNGKYLLFLNSDTEVLDDAITSLYSFFTGSTNTFNFVGPKLIEKDRITSQPSAGRFYALPVVFAVLFLRGDYYGLTRFSPNTTKQVDWVSGACFICKREDFEKLGGFDEGIFMYMEEIDLLYRAKKKGMTTGFYPTARFIHVGSASSQGRSQPIIQVYKGLLYFYQKHHRPLSSDSEGLQLSLLRIMLQLKAIISVLIGIAVNNGYLKTTYAEALKIATYD